MTPSASRTTTRLNSSESAICLATAAADSELPADCSYSARRCIAKNRRSSGYSAAAAESQSARAGAWVAAAGGGQATGRAQGPQAGGKTAERTNDPTVGDAEQVGQLQRFAGPGRRAGRRVQAPDAVRVGRGDEERAPGEHGGT